MSDTPRTDAISIPSPLAMEKHYIAMREHARRLERELAVAVKQCWDTETELHKAARPEGGARLRVMPIVKMLKDQRDECATVLRELLRLYEWRFELARMERDGDAPSQMSGLLNKYGHEKKAAWVAARAILEKCPSYTQQLRNVAEGLGMTYEELIEAVKSLPPMNPLP